MFGERVCYKFDFFCIFQVCNSPFTTCPVCLQRCPAEIMSGLTCGHRFCNDCWQQHFAVQIQTAVSTGKLFYHKHADSG